MNYIGVTLNVISIAYNIVRSIIHAVSYRIVVVVDADDDNGGHNNNNKTPC